MKAAQSDAGLPFPSNYYCLPLEAGGLPHLVFHGNVMQTLTRRTLLSSLAAGLGATLLAKGLKKPAVSRRILYVDGLCLPGEEAEMTEFAECGFQAVVMDVSAGEMVRLPDGTDAYRRTYTACRRGLESGIQGIQKKIPGGFVAIKGSEIPTTPSDPRIACFLQFQGCDWVENDIARIQALHAKGLRIAQITHHYGNTLAGGCMDIPQTGLTPFGREALREMERLRILPDLGHASNPTGLDVLKATSRPVIVSHGGCRALVNNARCTSDEVIRGVGDHGGVMGIFMMSFWLTHDPTPTVDHYIAQIRHVIKIAGIDAIGIANDYAPGGEPELRRLGNDNVKGMELYMPWWKEMRARGVAGFEHTPNHVVIPELNTPRRMFLLHAALERARFKSSEIEKIMGGNWVRVLKDALG